MFVNFISVFTVYETLKCNWFWVVSITLTYACNSPYNYNSHLVGIMDNTRKRPNVAKLCCQPYMSLLLGLVNSLDTPTTRTN